MRANMYQRARYEYLIRTLLLAMLIHTVLNRVNLVTMAMKLNEPGISDRVDTVPPSRTLADIVKQAGSNDKIDT